MVQCLEDQCLDLGETMFLNGPRWSEILFGHSELAACYVMMEELCGVGVCLIGLKLDGLLWTGDLV